MDCHSLCVAKTTKDRMSGTKFTQRHYDSRELGYLSYCSDARLSVAAFTQEFSAFNEGNTISNAGATVALTCFRDRRCAGGGKPTHCGSRSRTDGRHHQIQK